MIFVSLGSNLAGAYESPAHVLEAALALFPDYGLRVRVCSSFYQTPAVAPYPQPDFVNAVAEIASDLPARGVLAQLHAIEQAMGRRRAVRWGERVIDLDLLAYGNVVVSPSGSGPAPGEAWKPRPLELPHSGLSERAFVLVPLAEIAPDWRHPVSGERAAETLEKLPGAARAEIRQLRPEDWKASQGPA
ncbi:2-amino-4-hydroxy-6-hydroxymethyldihydropteridine diphosphokinase [Tepidicaulis sp. LMO-SS28]|uniref:2-amino-4-hydroxy-6- hydroxymethyldihydropteridine diphosphokinase n=1 Tax=Tepidicaulis sp. LMO-SS28 TaxID=3447455 RepID=UPI003EE0B9FD